LLVRCKTILDNGFFLVRYWLVGFMPVEVSEGAYIFATVLTLFANGGINLTRLDALRRAPSRVEANAALEAARVAPVAYHAVKRGSHCRERQTTWSRTPRWRPWKVHRERPPPNGGSAATRLAAGRTAENAQPYGEERRARSHRLRAGRAPRKRGQSGQLVALLVAG
jgi:hypothetical protein